MGINEFQSDQKDKNLPLMLDDDVKVYICFLWPWKVFLESV